MFLPGAGQARGGSKGKNINDIDYFFGIISPVWQERLMRELREENEKLKNIFVGMQSRGPSTGVLRMSQGLLEDL